MSNFLAAIRAQQVWDAKEKPARSKIMSGRREPIKDSAIMQILTLLDKNVPSRIVAKEVDVPVQTVYNVKQRYILIDVKNGTQWYKWLG